MSKTLGIWTVEGWEITDSTFCVVCLCVCVCFFRCFPGGVLAYLGNNNYMFKTDRNRWTCWYMLRWFVGLQERTPLLETRTIHPNYIFWLWWHVVYSSASIEIIRSTFVWSWVFDMEHGFHFKNRLVSRIFFAAFDCSPRCLKHVMISEIAIRC